MKKIQTEYAPMAIGPYSQALLFNDVKDLIFTSGQIAIDPSTGCIREGIIEQTKQVCENLQAILKSADSNLDNVIKTTCYLTNMGDFNEFNEVYEEYFKGKPARSCVGVKDLPKGVLCEIEVIARV